jgi:hypothetical protein
MVAIAMAVVVAEATAMAVAMTLSAATAAPVVALTVGRQAVVATISEMVPCAHVVAVDIKHRIDQKKGRRAY